MDEKLLPWVDVWRMQLLLYLVWYLSFLIIDIFATIYPYHITFIFILLQSPLNGFFFRNVIHFHLENTTIYQMCYADSSVSGAFIETETKL